MNGQERQRLRDKRRIVIKIGSSSLTHQETGDLNLFKMEQLVRIISGVKYPEKLKVCFDTCHVHDSGYDLIHHPEEVFGAFERIVGRDMIAVFHMNDSKNICGAAKDRHENYGFGQIGFEALQRIMYHPDYLDIPKILESPWVKDGHNEKKSYAPYKQEICSIRENRFDPEMVEKLRAGNGE